VFTPACPFAPGGELVRQYGQWVTLTIVDAGSGAVPYVVVTAESDPRQHRFLWDDVSPGVVTVQAP